MKRISDTLVEVLDINTNEYVSYNKVTTNATGGAMTDANCDGVIYRKLGSEYFKRAFTGAVYPRWFGAKGDNTTNDTAAFQLCINVAAALKAPIDGEKKSYKIAGLDLLAGTEIVDSEFTTTAGTYGLKIGDIAQPPTTYRRTLKLTNIKIKGQSTYAMIVSTITGVDINNLKFENCSCNNDVLYLLNIYDSDIDRLTFTGCTAGALGACISSPGGLNGVKISNIYTSAFTYYGINLIGGASLQIINPTIQGATVGMSIDSARGLHVQNPYFENVVNPVDIKNAVSDTESAIFYGGLWGGPYGSHPNLAQNNGVMVKYVGGKSITMIGGKFDVSDSSFKKLASVGGSGIINIIDPMLSNNSNTPEIKNYVFKEPTALSTAGYYLKYVRSGNAIMTVRRAGAIGNLHLAEYYDGNNNLVKMSWAPTNVGTAPAAESLYINRVSTIKLGSYSLSNSDDIVRFNVTSSNVIATLPTTGMVTGKTFTIKKLDGINNVEVITANGVATIDGLSNYIISGVGDTVNFQWDGTNYIILAHGKKETDPVFLAQKGVANGVATLDASVLIPVTQIPNLDGAKITSGTIPVARLGSGTASASTFLHGNNTWSALVAGDIPNLDTAKITTGVFAAARLGSGLATATAVLKGNSTWQELPVTNQRADLTAAQSDSELNALYPSAVIGTRVIAKNISGGGMIYEKDTTTTWIRIALV